DGTTITSKFRQLTWRGNYNSDTGECSLADTTRLWLTTDSCPISPPTNQTDCAAAGLYWNYTSNTCLSEDECTNSGGNLNFAQGTCEPPPDCNPYVSCC